MTQYFNVTLGGVDITDKVKSSTVNYSLHRIIDNASLVVTFMPKQYLGEEVVITHQDDVFYGIVAGYSRDTNLIYSIDVKSNTVKLSKPYFVDTEKMYMSTTAAELCVEFSYLSGVPITYNAIDFSFNGSWEGTSTPDNELLRMAETIGADVYQHNGVLIIENVKPVAGEAILINDNDIIDTDIPTESIENNGLGVVITKTSNDTTSTEGDDPIDVYAMTKIEGDVNTTNGRVKVYVSPLAPIDSYSGMSKIGRHTEVLTESKQMVNSDTFATKGAIKSITSATLNGYKISNYKFDPDTALIYFDTPQDGNLKVEYVTTVDEFSANIEPTPEGRFYNVEAKSGETYFRANGFMSEGSEGDDGWNVTDSYSDSSTRYYIPDGTDYVEGFVFYTDGDAKVDLYSGTDKVPFGDKITEEEGTYTFIDRVTLDKQEDGTYRVYVDKDAVIVDVTSAGKSIPYTEGTDADGSRYIQLDRFYPDVEIEYQVSGTKYNVQYPLEEEEQTIVIDDTTEIPLTPSESKWDDPAKFPCGYPADFPFNIPSLLGVRIEDCVGVTIVGMTAPIDSKGYCYAHIVTDGIYKYDTSRIKEKSSITLRANSNGSL